LFIVLLQTGKGLENIPGWSKTGYEIFETGNGSPPQGKEEGYLPRQEGGERGGAVGKGMFPIGSFLL